MSESNDPLFLQFKEAVESVLEPYAGKSEYAHHGQRVVIGQRLMQPASDLFLGWVTGHGKQFYVRQLRDAKISLWSKPSTANYCSSMPKPAVGCSLGRTPRLETPQRSAATWVPAVKWMKLSPTFRRPTRTRRNATTRR